MDVTTGIDPYHDQALRLISCLCLAPAAIWIIQSPRLQYYILYIIILYITYGLESVFTLFLCLLWLKRARDEVR